MLNCYPDPSTITHFVIRTTHFLDDVLQPDLTTFIGPYPLFALSIANQHAHQIGRTLDIESPFHCSYYNCRSRYLHDGSLSISVHTNEGINTLSVGK